MLNPKTKRLAYSVERIADSKKINAKRYPCLSGRQALNAKKYLIICVLLFVIPSNVYALNLDKLKINFLKGDYKAAISEGEKIIATTGASSAGLDELYYILGLAYLKDGNYLRASDIFEIILKEFKETKFRDDALLGLGDTYFLRGNYDSAQRYYQELINNEPQTKLKAAAYYRLSRTGFKNGNTKLAKEYLDKLKEDFPSNLELKENKDLYAFSLSGAEVYYSVQVGSFAKYSNAKSLCDKLIAKGYDAYTEDTDTNGAKMYRVKVGRLKSRSEIIPLENKLSSEGYPTKIIP